MNDNKRKLYDALSNDYDMGTYEQFRKDLEDKDKRRKLYDATSEAYDFGDYDQFEAQLGYSQSPSAPGAEEISSGSAGPVMPKPAMENRNWDVQMGNGHSRATVEKPEPVDVPIPQRPEDQEPSDEGTAAPSGDARSYLEYANRQQVANLSRDISSRLDEAQTKSRDIYMKEQEDARKGGFLSTLAHAIAASGHNPEGRSGGMSDAQQRTLQGADSELQSEISKLEAAKKAMSNAEEIIAEADKSVQERKFPGFVKGIARGFGDKLFDVNTWDMGVLDTKNSIELLKALRKYDEGEPLSESEQMLLDAKSVELATNAYFGSYIGRGYKAGAVTAQSLPFMLEMAVNPASTLGESTQSMLARYALSRFAKKGATRAAQKFATKAAGAAGRALGDIAGSAVMAGTSGAVRVAGDAIDRHVGDIETDMDGQGQTVFAGHDTESLGKSIAKAFASTAIENHSEMLGEYFAPALGIVSKLGRKGMEKFGLKNVVDFVDDVSATDAAKLIADFQKRTKWHGTIGEYAEEVAGNIENAILVGDNTLDASDDTGVFNLDQNIDTFLGVALMGGVFSTARTIGWRTPKYRARMEMEKARNKARTKYGSEAWQEIEDRMAEAGDSGMSAVLSTVIAGENSPEKAKALLDYAKSIKKYEGMLAGDEKRREIASPEATDLETSYENGYTLSTPQEVHDAKLMFEYQEAMLQKALGTSDIDIDTIMLGNEMGTLTDEQKSVAMDYLNAKATFDGVIDRVRDDIDSRISSVENAIDASTNRDTGMLQPASLVDDRPVHIISGIVRLTPDGTMVDTRNSENFIIVRDDKTGRMETISPSDINRLENEIDPAMEKQAARQQIQDVYGGREADSIDGVLAFNPGDTYTLTNGQGQSFPVQIVANEQGVADNGDGTVNVVLNNDIDTQTGQPRITQMPKEQIQEMAEATNLSRLQQYEQQKLARAAEQAETDATGRIPENPFRINDMITLSDAETGNVENGVVGSELTDDGKYEVVVEKQDGSQSILYLSPSELEQLGARLEQPEAVEERNAPVPEQNQPLLEQKTEKTEQDSAMSRIPLDRDGVPQFEQAQPSDTWEALLELNGGNAVEAEDTARQMYENASKNLDKAQKTKPKSGTSVMEIQRNKAERNGQIDELRKSVDFWGKVLSFPEAVRKSESAAAEAEVRQKEDAKREAVRQAKENLAKGRKLMQQKGTYYKDDAKLGDYLDFHDYALRMIANGRVKFVWKNDADNNSIKGLGGHLGLEDSESERKALFSLLANQDKGGLRPDDAAEQLSEEYNSSLGAEVISSSEALDVILDIIRTYGGKTRDMMNAAIDAHAMAGADERGYDKTTEALSSNSSEKHLAENPNDLPDLLPAQENNASSEEDNKPSEDKDNSKIAEGQESLPADAPLSNEINEFGVPFIESSDGTTVFGVLTDDSGLSPAPIKLSLGENATDKNGTNHGYGLLHIEAGHGDQIRAAGYSSIKDFVEDVARNYDTIREGGIVANNQTYLLELSDEHNNTLFIQLSRDGSYWNINSAGIFKKKYSRRKPEVFTRPALKTETDTDSGRVDSSRLNGVTAPAGNSHQTSESKDTNISEESNTGSEKSVAEQITEQREVVNTEPTDAQKEAGNYRMGHVKIDGMDVTIENPKGSIRRGTDADGKKWESEMHYDYGYIRGTKAVDNDHIDIFLSDNPETGNVFVVDQVNPKTGEFDESKVMYGFASEQEARGAYRSNYEKGWKGLGKITEVTREEFKKWIDSSTRKTKPFSEYASVKAAEAQKEKGSSTEVSDNSKNNTSDKASERGFILMDDFIKSALQEAYENRTDKSLSRDDWNEEDEAIDAENKANDDYYQYIESLSNSGELQKMYDASSIGEQIKMRKSIGEAGHEFKELIDTTKAADARKEAREKKKKEEYRLKMKNLGIDIEDDDVQPSTKKPEAQKEKPVQGLEGYSRDEIKNIVTDHINDVMRDHDIDAEIIGMDIHGSRNRHDARSDSDLDVVVEYSGDIREDDMFNALNGEEDALSIEGISVDINPIRKEETGDLQDYMKQSEEYDKEKSEHANVKPLDGNAQKNIIVDAFREWNGNLRNKYRSSPQFSELDNAISIAKYQADEGNVKPDAQKNFEKAVRLIPELYFGSGDIQFSIGKKNYETTSSGVKDFAEKYGVSQEAVEDYANGMRLGTGAGCGLALLNIRRDFRLANSTLKFAEFSHEYAKLKQELFDKFGDYEKLKAQQIAEADARRDTMEAARKRIEEEQQRKKAEYEARIARYKGMSLEELDSEYFKALENNDEVSARDIVDEVARRNGYADVTSDYQGAGAWAAPSRPGGYTDEERRASLETDSPDLSLEDISLGYTMQPDDIFDHPERYMQSDSTSKEAARAIKATLNALKKGNKDAKIKVFRAVPLSVKEGRLRNGDWVTPSRAYADMHGNHRLEGEYRVIEEEVPAKDLWWDGNDVREWGYDDGTARRYANVENNTKLNDVITRDDAGNIIPPSRRFDSGNADERYQIAGRKAIDEGSEESRIAYEAVKEQFDRIGIPVELLSDQAMNELAAAANSEEGLSLSSKNDSPRKQWINNYVDAMNVVTGRDKKKLRDELMSKISAARKEAKELYSNVLSGNFNDVTLQQINSFIDNATNRNRFFRPLSQRLPERALLALSRSGRQNEVDALFSRICESAVPANGRTGPEGRRRIEEKKEECLEGWARATGNWHESIADFTSNTEPIRSGTDSDVYLSDDGANVIKASKGKFDNKKFPSDIDQINLFNYVFPHSAYRILGYGRLNGSFVRFIEQPFVDFSKAQPLSVEERVSYMQRMGFEPKNKEKTLFSNGLVAVSDLQKSNIVRDVDGNIRVIDADVRIHSKENGGKFSYPPVEMDMPEFMADGYGPGLELLKRPDGVVYGATVGGKIYLNREHLNPNTPIHEYTHLWFSALEKANPELYKRGVELMKQLPVWEEVKTDPNYANLSGDDAIASECLSRLVGDKGADKLTELAKKAMVRGDIIGTANRISLIEEFKDWLKKFWTWVRDSFAPWTKEEASRVSVDDIQNMVLSDLAKGVNPLANAREESELKKTNDKFNEQLETFTIETADRYNFNLGRPSSVLLSAGIENKPIRLHGSKVAKKIRKHGFQATALRDLPKAIAHPIAVFDNLGREGNRSILTELKMDNGNVLVSIDLGRGTEVDFNIVSSAFGKKSKGILGWINGGKMRFVDKEKALNYLHLSAPIAEASDNAELLSAANIVKEFENPSGKERKPEFQFIGEKGAAHMDKVEEASIRLDNLSIARQMEDADKDAKTIKLATGWERGADGKWRYEISDANIKDTIDLGKGISKKRFEGDMLWNSGRLGNVVEAPEIFKAYPQLKDVHIETDSIVNDMPSNGEYNANSNRITIHADRLKYLNSILNHEIQHAIQHIEGFATGGTPEHLEKEFNAAKTEWRARAYAHELEETAKELGGEYNLAEVENALGKEYKELGMEALLPDKETRIKGANYFARGYADRNMDEAIRRFRLDESAGSDFNSYVEYMHIAGEVEARNVSARLGMTPDERRRTLALETEDVSREDQIILNDALNGDSHYEEEPEIDRIVREAKENGTYMKAPNGKPTNLDERQWAQVRTGAFKKWFGDWEKAARIEKLRRSEPVIISGQEYAGRYELNRESAKAWMKDNLRGSYVNEDTKNVIAIGRKGVNKVTSHSMGSEAHLKSIAAIPEMLRKAIFITREQASKTGAQYPEYEYYAVGLKIGDVDYTAKVTIGVDENGNKFYDHALTEIEKGKLLDQINGQAVSPGFISTEINPSVTKGKDTKLFSILQTNSSKIVDENGEPKVVYHGSPYRFFRFDKARLGQSTGADSAKEGFFFTDNKDLAELFSRYSLEKLPVSDVEQLVKDRLQNMSREELNEAYEAYRNDSPDYQDYADEAGSPSDREYLEMSGFLRDGISEDEAKRNYVQDSIENKIEGGYFSDMEEIEEELSSIGIEFGNNEQVFLNIKSPITDDIARDYFHNGEDVSPMTPVLQETKRMGHDGVVFTGVVENGQKGAANQYVAFEPGQIKSATDNVGTFDGEQDDIRYKQDGAVNGSRTSQDVETAAARLAESLGEKVRIVRDVNEIENLNKKVQENQRRSKGWFNTGTGEIVVVLPNATGIEDVQATILHEAVGHKGLRELVGEDRFDDFLDKVYAAATKATRLEIVSLARRNHWDFRLATEEYIAGLAEKGFSGRENRTLFGKIKDFFLDMLSRAKIELGFNIGDNELRYMLWRTYQMRTSRGILAKANDMAVQQELKVGNFREDQLRGRNGFTVNDIAEMETPILESRGTFAKLADAEKWAKENLQGKTFINSFTGDEINISGHSIKEMLAPKFSKAINEKTHMAAIMSVPDFIETGIPAEIHKDTHGRGYDVMRLYNAIVIDGEPYRVKSTVKRYVDGDRYYTYEIQEMELLKGTQTTALGLDDSSRPQLQSSITGANLLKGVKKTNSDEEILSGDDSRLRFRTSGNGGSSNTARDIYEEKTRVIDRNGRKSDTANLMRRLKEAYVDSMQSLKYLQDAISEETGKPVEDFENAYLAENSMSSKNKAQTDIYLNRFFNPIKDAIRDLQKEGAEYGDIVRYLMAKHGLERNEVFSKRDAEKDGGVWDGSVRRDYSGLTELTRRDTDTVAPRIDEITSRAEDIVRKFEMDHDTDVLWEKINAATKDTLRTSYITGMLTKDNYEMVRSMFRYYIPLRGWSENTASAVYDYLSDARPKTSSIVKSATGRTTISDDPIATIAYMGQSAIIQGNRNLMKQKLLNLALNHKTGLLTVSRQWEVLDPVTGMWAPRDPAIPADAAPEQVTDIVADFEKDMKEAEKKGVARLSRGKLDTGKHLTAYEGQEHIIKVKRGGIDYSIYLNGNPRAAQAVNGMTNPDAVDSWLIRYARVLKNFLARMLTSQNPSFIISNLSRDLIFAGAAVYVKEDAKYAARYAKNITAALAKGQMLGLIHRFETDRLDNSKDLDRYFGEFIRNGGETGFTQLNTVDDFKRDIDRFAREMKQGQVMKVPTKVWNGIWDGVELMNRCAEDVTRFSAYMTSRQMGRSVERSISDAKEITVNFNRKGSGGYGARLMNFAYVFFNAAVQSLANAGKMSYEHPAKVATILGAFSASGFLAPLLAQAIISVCGGDDDAYWDLPEWVRRNNFVFYIPWSDNKFLIIPISQELRPFYAMGEIAMSVLMGKEEVLDGLKSAAGSFMDLLPIDFMGNGGNLAISLTPTVAQPFAQLVANTDYFGSPIYRRNDYNKFDPAWTKAYKGTSPMLVNASKWLNELTGGDDVKRGWIDPVNNPAVIEHLFESYLGGVGKTLNKAAKTFSMIWNPDMRDIRNIPIASTFIQESDDERVAGNQLNREYFKLMDEFRETSHTVSGYKKKARMGSMEYADKLNEFMETPDFERYSKARGYANTISKLRQALKKAQESGEDVMVEENLRQILHDLKRQMVEELKEQ